MTVIAGLTMKYTTEWMRRNNISQAARIEDASFPNPWTIEDFEWCLKMQHVMGCLCFADETPVAFMVYEFTPDHIEILNLATDPDFRLQGAAKHLLSRLLVRRNESTDHRRIVMARTRETNLAAQFFFRSVGFKAVKVIRGYYVDSEEDAYQFEFDKFSCD